MTDDDHRHRDAARSDEAPDESHVRAARARGHAEDPKKRGALDAPDPAVRAADPLGAGVLLWVLNLSRAFIAGGKTGALVIVVIVTVAIMAGAAMMSAMPRMRTTSKLLLVAFAVALIVSAGIVTLGPSEDHDEAGAGGFQEPTGKAVATVEVDALPTLKFQADEFTTQAGINEIDYLDRAARTRSCSRSPSSPASCSRCRPTTPARSSSRGHVQHLLHRARARRGRHAATLVVE